ncbi:GNAT family N-acetyltransferase [Myxococcota bacterium]|nr:GNAT family N-acetyltransferase [Myxococcota bacterium]
MKPTSSHGKPKIDIEVLSTKHADAMQRCASDSKVSATSDLQHPYPEGEALRFIANTAQVPSLRAFAILVDGVFGGVVSLNHVDRKGGIAQLSYWVAVPMWGRGIATAAASLAVRYAQNELGLRRLRSRCLENNAASRRVLEKLGFQLHGSFTSEAQAKTRFRGARVLRYRCRLGAGGGQG